MPGTSRNPVPRLGVARDGPSGWYEVPAGGRRCVRPVAVDSACVGRVGDRSDRCAAASRLGGPYEHNEGASDGVTEDPLPRYGSNGGRTREGDLRAVL